MSLWQDGYDLNHYPSQLPERFRETAECAALYVDIIGAKEDSRDPEARGHAANRAVFRIELKEKFDTFDSVHIAMELDEFYKPYEEVLDEKEVMLQKGCLILYGYSPYTSGTVASYKLSINEGWKVMQVVQLLLDKELHKFRFVSYNGQCCGCRDFM